MQSVGQASIAEEAGKAGHPVVLQVLPALVTGGVERSTIDIAEALRRAGGTAVVASAGGPLERELARCGAIHVTLPLKSKNPVTLYRNIARLVAVIDRYGVELVHARSRAPAWSAYYAARRRGLPFVTTFHGTYNFKTALKKRYNAIMTRGDRVIANSAFIARHIRENYALDPARLRVVHRGIDLARFDATGVSAERVAALARHWGLPTGRPVVLLPGRLTRWKGQALLIEAAALLRDPDFVAVMVGSDQGRVGYRAELAALIRARGLEGRVLLLEQCDDMPAAYCLARVVVSASTDPEAFGRVVSEAQALGRPVVAADHGGAPEQILPGETGFLFPPGDAAGLAAALRRALALDAAAREALARLAPEHVRRHFSLEQMGEKTLAVYRELLR